MFVIPASSISALARRHQYTNYLDALANVVATYNPWLCRTLARARAEDEQIHQPQLAAALTQIRAQEPVPPGSPEPPVTVAGPARDQVAQLLESFPKLVAPVCAEHKPVVMVHPLESVERAVTTALASVPVPPVLMAPQLTENRESAVAAYEAAVQVALEPRGLVDAGTAHANSGWARTRGTLLEVDTLGHLVAQGHDVLKTDTLLHSVHTVDGHQFKVIGRVDGLSSDGNTVYEIKNRTNRFFVPGYDLDQLATYSQLTGARSAVLVQQFQGDHHITTYTGPVMQARWAHILRDLVPVLEIVQGCRDDPGNEEALFLARKLVTIQDE